MTKSAIHVTALDVPASSFLSPKSRSVLERWTARIEQFLKEDARDRNDILAYRKCWAEKFGRPLAARFAELYSVRVRPQMIAGVSVEIIEPADEVSSYNPERVLINLHGGGFRIGGRYGGQMESIPVAALGKITVVSVDYRMAPEHRFPAATEDVAAVYRELLRDYSPENIGIYGCSAGGVLTAQAIAWLQKHNTPLPGAAGMLFGAGAFWTEGDSGCFRPLFAGAPLETAQEHPYFKDADLDDPLVFPVRSDAVMAKFPPSLLVAATRDHALSSVVQTHSCLIKQGVDARLHIWEGLGHAFFYDPDLPQSHEVYDVIVRFFDRQLAS